MINKIVDFFIMVIEPDEDQRAALLDASEIEIVNAGSAFLTFFLARLSDKVSASPASSGEKGSMS